MKSTWFAHLSPLLNNSSMLDPLQSAWFIANLLLKLLTTWIFCNLNFAGRRKQTDSIQHFWGPITVDLHAVSLMILLQVPLEPRSDVESSDALAARISWLTMIDEMSLQIAFAMKNLVTFRTLELLLFTMLVGHVITQSNCLTVFLRTNFTCKLSLVLMDISHVSFERFLQAEGLAALVTFKRSQSWVLVIVVHFQANCSR